MSNNSNSGAKKKYINGVFGKVTWPTPPQSFIVQAGINKEEFIRNLQAVPANAKGFINITIATQKTDPQKISVWLDEWTPSNSPNQQTQSADNQDIDQLPF